MDKIDSYTEVDQVFGVSSPGRPAPGEMFVFKDEAGVPQGVKYLCPCGCGNEIWTPLVTPDRPRKDKQGPIWDYLPGPTLVPSVRWTGGCRAHFNITDGKTVWADDTGK